MTPEYIEHVLRQGLIEAKRAQLVIIGFEFEFVHNITGGFDYLRDSIDKLKKIEAAAQADLSVIAKRLSEEMKK